MTNPDRTPVQPTVFDMEELSCLIVALVSMRPVMPQAALGWAPPVHKAVAKALSLVTLTPTETYGMDCVSVAGFSVTYSHADNAQQNGSN